MLDLRSRRLIVTGKGPKTRAVVIGSSTAILNPPLGDPCGQR